jgi:hypothetical protein
MPAWTNLHFATVGDIKVGSKTVIFNGTHFEVVSHDNGKTMLRCYEGNPKKGYGEGVLVAIDSITCVEYDSNRQGE